MVEAAGAGASWRGAAGMRAGRWLAAVALLAAAALQHRACARTLERDVYALISLHEEVRGRDPFWAGAMAKWPVHTCSANGTCGVDPCGYEWEGDGWEGVSCRYQWDWDKSIPRVVTNLHLPKRQLTGPLPKSLALLANITELDMDTNQLDGPLPAEWGCLGNLIEIDFSNNRLTGTIPPEWGLLRGLIEMELDGNFGLSGCVPDGCPPFEWLCGRYRGPPCPSFTTDVIIGTDIVGTRIRNRCAPPAGGDQALRAGLRCPVVADFRQPILAFFEREKQLRAEKADNTTTATSAAATAATVAASPSDSGMGAFSIAAATAAAQIVAGGAPAAAPGSSSGVEVAAVDTGVRDPPPSEGLAQTTVGMGGASAAAPGPSSGVEVAVVDTGVRDPPPSEGLVQKAVEMGGATAAAPGPSSGVEVAAVDAGLRDPPPSEGLEQTTVGMGGASAAAPGSSSGVEVAAVDAGLRAAVAGLGSDNGRDGWHGPDRPGGAANGF